MATDDEPDGEAVIPIAVSIEAIVFHMAYLCALRQMMDGVPEEGDDEILLNEVGGVQVVVGKEETVEFLEAVNWRTPLPGDDGWAMAMAASREGAQKAVRDVCEAFGLDPDVATFDQTDMN